MKPELIMCNEQLLVDPDDGGIVNHVQKDEVVENSLADVRSRCFDSWNMRCVSNDGMYSNPREKLEYIIHSFDSHAPAALENKQNNSRRRDDCAVDIEGCHD